MPTTPPTTTAASLRADLMGALETLRVVAGEVLDARAEAGSGEVDADGQSTVAAQWVTLAALARQVESAAAAVGLVAGVRVAATDEVFTDDGELVEIERGIGHHRLDAPDLLAPAWGCTPRFADSRLSMALDAATRCPGLLGALADGKITDYGVRVTIDTIRDLDEAQCTAVTTRLLDWLQGRERVLDPTKTRAKVKALITQFAPESLTDASEVTCEQRSLRRFHDRVAGQTWEAHLVNGDADLAWSAIDRRARQLKLDGRADTLEQARADALVELILAQVDVRVTLMVTTPLGLAVAATGPTAAAVPTVATRPGVPTAPANPIPGLSAVASTSVTSVTGLGAGVIEVDASWLAQLRTKVGTRVQTMTYDPATGYLARPPAGTDRHDPPVGLVRWLAARDGRCRFPGCDVSPTRCDLDHVIPWPTGPTEATNLLTLCRHHHRIKQRAGWRVALGDNGSATWVDPHGTVRTSHPHDHRAGPAPTPAPSPEPEPDRPASGPPSSDSSSSRRSSLRRRSQLEDHLALLPTCRVTRAAAPGRHHGIDWQYPHRTLRSIPPAYSPPPF